MGTHWIPVLVSTLCACGGGGGDGTTPDTGAPDADTNGLAIPWLEDGRPPVDPPGLTPCAEGWHEVTSDSGTITCAPYPAAGPHTCGEGEAHFLGEPGCTPIGPPCPADGLPDGLPADRAVVFVHQGAPAGGDGSRARPHDDLGAVSFGGARANTIVAVGTGTYEGIVRLPRAIGLWGACVAGTTLTSTVGLPGGVVTVLGAGTEVRRLRIADAARPGLWVEGADRSLAVEDVVIENVAELGAVVFDPGASASFSTLVLRGTRPNAAGDRGRGLDVENGASADVERALLDGNRGWAVFSDDVGTSVRLTDVALRETSARGDGTFGRALEALEGPTVELHRVLAQGHRDVSILASIEGTSLRLSDSVIRDTRSRVVDDTDGRALSALFGASIEVVRTTLEHSREAGLLLDGDGTRMRGEDLVIRETEPELSTLTGGRGVSVQRGADGELLRAIVEDNRELGVYASMGTTLSLAHVVIRETEMKMSDGTAGRALDVQEGATATVQNAVFDRSRELGVFVSDGADLSLTDTVISQTRTTESGRAGRSLGVQSGSSVALSRVLARDSVESGALVHGMNSVLSAEHVVIRDVRTCTQPDCTLAIGAAARAGGTLTVDGFVVERVGVCGVQVGDGSDVDLSNGSVRECPIGACVQSPGFDVERISRTVRYEDNDVNLQTTELPLPEPAQPIQDL